MGRPRPACQGVPPTFTSGQFEIRRVNIGKSKSAPGQLSFAVRVIAGPAECPARRKVGGTRERAQPDPLRFGRRNLTALEEARVDHPASLPAPPGERIKDFRRPRQGACRRAKVGPMLRHDFRRTAVRNLVDSGVSERVAMEVTGHETRSVFDRYHIVSPADLQEAAQRLTA